MKCQFLQLLFSILLWYRGQSVLLLPLLLTQPRVRLVSHWVLLMYRHRFLLRLIQLLYHMETLVPVLVGAPPGLGLSLRLWCNLGLPPTFWVYLFPEKISGFVTSLPKGHYQNG